MITTDKVTEIFCILDEFIIRKTICPKSQNDLSEDWGDNTAFFGRVVFGWFVYP